LRPHLVGPMFDKRYRVERGRHGAPKVRRPVGGQLFKSIVQDTTFKLTWYS
jgi:hypothetical protein